MSKIDSFIQAYNKLDSFMREKLKQDHSISHAKLLSQMARHDAVFAHIETKLQAYRALRNAIVHIHNDSETPIAMPNEDVVKDYQNIVSYALTPPLALESLAITHIISIDWETKLKDVNELMENNGLSLIPIIQEGKMAGIFSSWFLQRFLFERNFNLNNETPVKEMYQHLNLNQPISFINRNFRIGFMRADATLDDVVKSFHESAKNGHYYKAVYLSDTGAPGEKLHGVITPHCLPAINPNLVNKKLNI